MIDIWLLINAVKSVLRTLLQELLRSLRRNDSSFRMKVRRRFSKSMILDSILMNTLDLPRRDHPDDVMDWAEEDVGIPHQHAEKLFNNDIDIEELETWSRDLANAKAEMVKLYDIPGKWAGKLVDDIPRLFPSAAGPMAAMTPTSPAVILDASHDAVRLWHALLAGKVKFLRRKVAKEGEPTTMDIEAAESESDTGAIALSDGVVWLHAPSSRHLYVRPCSFQVCGLIDKRRPKGRGAVVTYTSFSYGLIFGNSLCSGTSGIGKSWNANLLLLRAAKERRNVIFESVEKDVAYFFASDGSVRALFRPRQYGPWPFQDDLATLYIIDAGAKGVAREPLEINAFTVVLASPNEQNYGQFLKRIGLSALFFLPEWTVEDICAVLPFVEDRVQNDIPNDAAVETRFAKIGGVPRYVFSSAKDFNAAVSKLTEGLSKLSSFDFHELIEKEKDWNKIPNFVFTLHSRPPDFDSDSTIVRLASEFATQELPKHMTDNHFRQLLAISSATRDLTTAMFSTPEGYALFNSRWSDQATRH